MPNRPLLGSESEPMSRRMFKSADSCAWAYSLIDGFTLLMRVRIGFENASAPSGAERTIDIDANFMLLLRLLLSSA